MTDKPKPKPPRPGINPFAVGGGAPVPRRANRPKTRKQVVAEQLGARPDEVAEMDAGDLKGITTRDAARLLGQESYADRRDKKALRTRWRFEHLRRFRTDAGRRRLVALLERSLTGEELEVPAEVEEAIGNLLAIDREQTPDAPQLLGLDDRSDTAQAYARYKEAGGASEPPNRR